MAGTVELILYGEERAETAVEAIAIGRMSMLFVAGSLEDIAIDGEVVMRAVQFVHRDRYWRRIEPTLDAFEVARDSDQCRAMWTLRYDGDECDLSVALVVEVTDGQIAVTAEARAVSPTVTNRTGFILLHPALTTAGRQIDVTHPDGTVTHEAFPQVLSPHAVLAGITALDFPYDGNVKFSVALTGDVFETEDQRNWTDFSFKTFSRPLSEPIPYKIEPGAPVRQTVCIRAKPQPAEAAGQVAVSNRRPVDRTRPRSPAAAFLRLDGEAPEVHASLVETGTERRMPGLGFGVHYERAGADKAMVEALCRLRPTVLQLRLNPADPTDGIAEFAHLTKRTGANAALELISGYREGDRGLNRAVDKLVEAGCAPTALTLYPETDSDLAAARAEFPDVPIGGGTPIFFVLAHRARLPAGLDFVQWTMPPGVHDIADRSVMETLACVPAVLGRAHQLWPDKPLWIGPNSLRPRFRPTTLNPDIAPLDPDGRPDDIDPRQHALFGASWAVGFISRLAYGGADTALMFEPFGMRGVMHRATSVANAGLRTFPIYDVLLALADARGRELIPVEIDREDLVLGLAWSGEAPGALFANLTPRSMLLHVSGIGGLSAHSVTTGQPVGPKADVVALSAFEVVAFGDVVAT